MILEIVRIYPELFPAEIKKGFKMKDIRNKTNPNIIPQYIMDPIAIQPELLIFWSLQNHP